MEYLYNVLYRFNVSDFKEIAPEYFEITFPFLEDSIRRRKLKLNRKNLSEILTLEVKKNKFDLNNIITTIFDLELEYVIKYSKRFEWTAHKFIGNSNQEEISDLTGLIRTAIRNDKNDALVVVKKVDNLFWISIVMKNLKKVGIYEKPRYVALSTDGRYFFTKDNRTSAVIEYLTTTLGYEKEKVIQLSGRSLQTLIKLLHRRDKADLSNRPEYECREPVENEYGLDFTQKQNYFDFFDKCVDNETDINLQSYKITAVNCPWLGDDIPCLQQMEFKSAITLRGDVARIIKQLPVASIVKPPLPNYLKNFSVRGRNSVSIKMSLP